MNRNAFRVAAMVFSAAMAGCGMAPGNWSAKNARSPAAESPVGVPAAPTVAAGWADDNQQYNRYLGYLEQFSKCGALRQDVSGRVVFLARDANGRSVQNCQITVRDAGGKLLDRRVTYADGRAMFFSNEAGKVRFPLKVQAEWGGQTLSQRLDPQGLSTVNLEFGSPRQVSPSVPLDVAFVLDTTGSMGDEIEKLRATLAAIHYQITQMSPRPNVRFAMVLYRDHGDQYVTRVTNFTPDIGEFSRQLQSVTAGGGGDAPEDVQEALRVTAESLSWRSEAVKIAFLVGDAAPHLDYGEKFTYVDFMHAAAERGIKLTAIGASGLDDRGEYVFRQIAQYTMGLFVFLTYGEQGQTGPQTRTLVSHHTGDQWATRNLDEIVVRSIARELAYLGDRPPASEEDFFEAQAAEGVDNRLVLDTLFGDCARQLVGFSQSHLAARTPTAVVSAGEENCSAELAGALGDQLRLAVSRQECFRLIEREDLRRVMDERDFQRAFDAAGPAVRPAGPAPADLIVLYRLRRADQQYQMFVKLVRVQTGEVLSASMLKIDHRLGPA